MEQQRLGHDNNKLPEAAREKTKNDCAVNQAKRHSHNSWMFIIYISIYALCYFSAKFRCLAICPHRHSAHNTDHGRVQHFRAAGDGFLRTGKLRRARTYAACYRDGRTTTIFTRAPTGQPKPLNTFAFDYVTVVAAYDGESVRFCIDRMETESDQSGM